MSIVKLSRHHPVVVRSTIHRADPLTWPRTTISVNLGCSVLLMTGPVDRRPAPAIVPCGAIALCGAMLGPVATTSCRFYAGRCYHSCRSTRSREPPTSAVPHAHEHVKYDVILPCGAVQNMPVRCRACHCGVVLCVGLA